MNKPTMKDAGKHTSPATRARREDMLVRRGFAADTMFIESSGYTVPVMVGHECDETVSHR